MIKKLMTVAVSIVVLSGCGGGSDDKSITEQIKERDGILIMHNYPAAACKSTLLRNVLADDDAENILTSVEPDTTSCADYGRSSNGNRCLEQEQNANSDVACVIAFDVDGLGLINVATIITDK